MNYRHFRCTSGTIALNGKMLTAACKEQAPSLTDSKALAGGFIG